MKRTMLARLWAMTTALLVLGLISAPVYAKSNKAKNIPPGLAKKAEKGKSLPPGWQKKLVVGETLDQELFEQGEIIEGVNVDGILTIRIEDRIVRLFQATMEIVEILKD